MFKCRVVLLVLALSVSCLAQDDKKLNSVEGEDNLDSFGFVQCDEKDTSLSCQSIRIARNVLQQLIRAKNSDGAADVKLIEGVELVKTRNLGDGGRNLNDGTMLGKLAGYLQEHEIRVKLPDLLGKEGMNGVLSETLRSFNKQNDLVETGRKKNRGQGILLMGLMMAKTLAAIGFGGLGLLTMKALMVSALALMLSAIIGVKKLASSGGDDGGHQVHYVQAHDHHRRRRMLGDEDYFQAPYKGWLDYMTEK